MCHYGETSGGYLDGYLRIAPESIIIIITAIFNISCCLSFIINITSMNTAFFTLEAVSSLRY